MIECYSNSITVGENEAIPFNSVALKKGATVELSGAAIQFNKCGIYEVCVNASASGAAGETLAIQLRKGGTLQPQGYSSVTAAGGDTLYSLSFITLVQVPFNYSCNVCAAPTVCEIVNEGAEADFDHISVVVTKLV